MSQYIVFRCTNCGMVGINEARTRPIKPKKRINCYYCRKSTIFDKGLIYGLYGNPYKAKNIATGRNLELQEFLTPQQKAGLYDMGAKFSALQGEKIIREKPRPKLSKREAFLKACKDLQDREGFVDEDELEQSLTPLLSKKQFESFYNFYRSDGTLQRREGKICLISGLT